MRFPYSRYAVVALALGLGVGLADGAGAPAAKSATGKDPNKLVILSTTDVKAKTAPCGCHIPKGGLSRRASFGDSIKALHDQVAVVDAGGFFPENDQAEYQDAANFMMDAMKLLGSDAVGVGERELRYGYSFLKINAERAGLPIVCANLFMRASGKPALTPYVIKKVGSVKVGMFGLMNDKVTYGPSQDSLRVEEPAAATRRVVAEMKKKGATVIVLLSQLGKVESEDLVAAVPGVDVLIVGHANSLLMKGRMVKNTVACYGGEQGQYMGRTTVSLNSARGMATGDAEAFMLGPEVGESPEMAKLVKAFEDGFNEKLRKVNKERAAAAAAKKGTENPDRFLGMSLCVRCHQDEADQWKTTAHSLAWETLVENKKESTPECVTCHVVGYRQPGGFRSDADANKLADVQCENCHGMGTQHDAFASSDRTVTEQVCITCHQGENDPEWNWAKKLPMIVHSNKSGESMRSLQSKKGKMMKPHDSTP